MSRIYSIEEAQVEALITIPENPRVISVWASGRVPTSGWSHPDLAPWMYIRPPDDGIIDLDFVATAPPGNVLQVLTRIAVAKAFLVPRWVIGVRVHSSTNKMEAKISGGVRAMAVEDAAPYPWPWPWWAPEARK